MGCALYNLAPLYNLLGLIFIMLGLLMTFCSKWVQKYFIAGIVQILTFTALMQVLASRKLYDSTVTPMNIFAFILSIILSISTAVAIGKLFKNSVRLGPIIIGIILGACSILIMLPFLETTIAFITPFDIGFWLSFILVLFGCCFGLYLGYRLAFVITISTQAFISSYLIVRGISLNIGGFPNEL